MARLKIFFYKPLYLCITNYEKVQIIKSEPKKLSFLWTFKLMLICSCLCFKTIYVGLGCRTGMPGYIGLGSLKVLKYRLCIIIVFLSPKPLPNALSSSYKLHSFTSYSDQIRKWRDSKAGMLISCSPGAWCSSASASPRGRAVHVANSPPDFPADYVSRFGNNSAYFDKLLKRRYLSKTNNFILHKKLNVRIKFC
jgi:hypothetical protein